MCARCFSALFFFFFFVCKLCRTGYTARWERWYKKLTVWYIHVIYISVFSLWLYCPGVCLSLFNSYANRENSFSLLVSDVRMGSSKISPPALLSASLLYFTTQQHSPGSSGLVLSQHISVMALFGPTDGPQVQTTLSGRMEMVIGQRKHTPAFKRVDWIHNVHYTKGIGCTTDGLVIRTWHSVNQEVRLVAAGCSFCYTQTHTIFVLSQRESGAKCLSYATAQHTALICSPARETKPRGSSSLNKDTARLPHGGWKANLVQSGSQAAEQGLPDSFQLLLKDSSCYSPGASVVWI